MVPNTFVHIPGFFTFIILVCILKRLDDNLIYFLISLFISVNYFQDCHGQRDGNGAPIQDDTQNYTVINGYQNATHTVIQFKRALETCDPDDLVITVI